MTTTKRRAARAMLGACTALGLAFPAAQALAADPAADSAYWRDTRGEYARSGHGLCWRAGYWTPAQAAAECDPDLVKVAEAPRPAPAPAPAPAPRRCDFTYALQNDQTFAFDKAQLTVAAKAAIDREVVARLAACGEVKLVVVTGHTDRLGSEAYNDRLSLKRAETVKAYLAGKGVRAELIETAGKGESAPVKDCDGGQKRKALIACLAPNRRTIVKVSGTAK